MSNIVHNSFSNNRSVSVYFILLISYLVINMMTTTAGAGGGGVYNQLLGAIIVIYCSLIVVFSKGLIPPEGRVIYRVLLWLYAYIVIRVIVMFLFDTRLALSSVRNSITILFWVVSLLFCLQEFGISKTETISKLSVFLIVFSFIAFLYSIFIEHRYYQSIDSVGAVNAVGSAYMLVPLILLILKGKVRFVGYLLCLVVCAWSHKRQCVLGFGVVSFFLILDLIKAYFKTFKLRGVLYLFVALAFSTVIFDTVFSGILERQRYLNERDDVDSGRIMIWEMAIDGYEEAPVVDKLFGGGPATGARYVESRTGGWFVMPHNGFIEVMCDYGIVGLFLYVLFFYSLIRTSYKYPRGSIKRRMLLGISMSWIMSNVFSHAGRVWAMYFCIAIGFLLCINNGDKSKSLL